MRVKRINKSIVNDKRALHVATIKYMYFTLIANYLLLNIPLNQRI